MKSISDQKMFLDEVCDIISEKYSMKGTYWKYIRRSEKIAFIPYQKPQGAFDPLELKPMKGDRIYYGLEELKNTPEELAWKIARDNKGRIYKTAVIMIT